MGTALVRLGRLDEAISHYEKALALTPNDADAHCNLGDALVNRQRPEEAVAHYRKALEIKPGSATTNNNLGYVLASSGRLTEAIAEYQMALRLSPNYPTAHKNLEDARANQRAIAEWLAEQRVSLRSHPNDLGRLNATAWLLATCPDTLVRNGAEAVELAQRAVKISDGREAAILGTLAAAYAEAGRFPEAVVAAQKALALAVQQNQQPLVKSIEGKVPLYKTKKPYREPSRLPALLPSL